MEKICMGLDSKDTVFKNEECKQPDGFECFNNHQKLEMEIPVMMNNPFFKPIFSGAPVYTPWYESKVASAPAQLTICYNGVVNVYDGVSPEKAQAIMRLAGNGHFVATVDAPQQRTQAQGPTPTSPVRTQPCSPVLSPKSVSSHYVVPLTGGPPDETEAAKRIMSSLGQSALPQARKASLARFLEKRKERVMASAPYSLSKNIMDCASNSDAAVVADE